MSEKVKKIKSTFATKREIDKLSFDDLTRTRQQAIVVQHVLNEILKSEKLFVYALNKLPKYEEWEKSGDTKFYRVQTEFKVSYGRTSIQSRLFFSKAEAEDYIRKNPVGHDMGDLAETFQKDILKKELAKTSEEGYVGISGIQFATMAENYDLGPEHLDILAKAGVLNDSYGPSRALQEYVSKEKYLELKKRFGENWSVIAELDYCYANFPVSSLVGIAARIQVAAFITNDEYTLGYLVSEMREGITGARETAEKQNADRKTGAVRGGKKQAEKYRELRNKLLNSIIPKAGKSLGVNFLDSPIQMQAEILKNIAESEFTGEFVRSEGNPLSLNWFIERIEDLKAEQKFSGALLGNPNNN